MWEELPKYFLHYHMRILYITTIGTTVGFFKYLIRELIDEGNTVDIATNESENKVAEYYKGWGCKIFDISCSRSALTKGNIDAIKEIRQIIAENNYDIVHCHTPIAAACARIACRKQRKLGLKVIYTAHGFHFYIGAPLKNWLIYYSVEWLCSWWTDVLIAINKEDYFIAKKHLHAKDTEYVPGVGIDLSKFLNRTDGRERKRRELGLSNERMMLLSIGELNENKNHESVIKAIEGIESLTYVIVGKGGTKEKLQRLKGEIDVDVRLMGYRSDVSDFYDAADVYILPSIREGLNVSLMEAMASGLPCLCGNIRGNVDLIDDNGGYLFDPSSVNDIRNTVQKAVQLSKEERKEQGYHNLEKVRGFDKSAVNSQMKRVYETVYGC